MNFEQLEEFGKNLKKLLKRYKTLEEDLEVVRKVLSAEPAARPPFSFHMDGLGVHASLSLVNTIPINGGFLLGIFNDNSIN